MSSDTVLSSVLYLQKRQNKIFKDGVLRLCSASLLLYDEVDSPCSILNSAEATPLSSVQIKAHCIPAWAMRLCISHHKQWHIAHRRGSDGHDCRKGK